MTAINTQEPTTVEKMRGLRKVAAAILLLTPWVLSQFGLQTTTIDVATTVLAFGICPAIGETGKYPWLQEFIPASVRGKYTATSNIFRLIDMAASRWRLRVSA